MIGSKSSVCKASNMFCTLSFQIRDLVPSYVQGYFVGRVIRTTIFVMELVRCLTELDLTLYMVSVYNITFFLDFPVLLSISFSRET